ncbi:glycosyl hydrolase catalytic core-domain-containing protein [Lasiosphaeris hirsuta]|uniref:Glycosyl hydrolase catalytic core-domain-containing protein n=1 Tax=Lasiosphaeris hirsuta TaxID=260670 RepID=A0AA40DXM7_9PEZI|nr:glycosyl hydrolase catalytic core-domain-containing protein [Lasiosphaeris hirsuta]
MKFSLTAAAVAYAALVSAAPAQLPQEQLPLAAEPREANHTLSARTDAPYGIKKGLAYNDGSITNVLSRPGSATWAYNWGAAPNAPRFQQIPMFWGPGRDGDVNGVMARVNEGAPWVLGYNEPDVSREHGGCAATPRQAYDAWGNDMFRYSDRGAKLVCPAISSWDTPHGHTGGPSGFVWLREFAGIGNNPGQFRCEAQALHWYGRDGLSGRDQAQLFIDYVAYANVVVSDIFRRQMDLWITEFSPLPVRNPQVMAEFLDIVIPWLDRQPFVARYSPFMAETLVSGSSLNVAGQIFVDRSG